MSGAHSHTAAARLLAEYFTVDLFDWSREQDPGFAGWPACTCGHQFDEHNNFDPGGLRGDPASTAKSLMATASSSAAAASSTARTTSRRAARTAANNPDTGEPR